MAPDLGAGIRGGIVARTMDLILLQKVDNLGGLGDRIKVRPGYGRNYLIPTGRAVPATPERIKEFEARRAELERLAAEALAQAAQRREQIDGQRITIEAKSGGGGKLYGSVGPLDIAEAAKNAGLDIERREVRMPQGPIGMAGEYEITIYLHADVEARLTVEVVGVE